MNPPPDKGRLERTAALLGEDALRRLGGAKALVVGVGGVGSWCAEALARTGIGSITVMDDDTVAPSNLNRQCPALVSTLGRPKVEAMKALYLRTLPSQRDLKLDLFRIYKVGK